MGRRILCYNEKGAAMNVFDFDKTIYDGDSTRDFFVYCLKKYPKTWKTLPRTGGCGMLFLLRLMPKTRFKQNFYRFVRCVPQIEQAVEAFWDSHMGCIQDWYCAIRQAGDLVISASPEFLLRPVCRRLGILEPIASRVDAHTGIYTGLNCWGEEKVRRFRARMGDQRVQKFYSDSRSDAPMAALAEQSFLIKDGKVLPWPW